MGILGVLLLAACESDPPSCQQAMTHYYGAQCTFINANTNMVLTQNEAFSTCTQVNAAVPDRCRGEFETWLECLNSVVGKTDVGCDCSQEQDALFACD